MKPIQSTIYLLCFLCYFTNTQAAISTPIADSTYQQVIEFTHKKKRKKKSYFFQKGEKVVIKKKGRLFPIRGKIEGFTEDGIIIKGQEIKIEEIKSIRRRSIGAFILSLFSQASIVAGIIGIGIIGAIVGGLSSFSSSGGDGIGGALAALFLLFILGVAIAILIGLASIVAMLLGVGLIAGIAASVTRRTNKFFNLRRWNARIITKKLPVK